MSLNNAKVIDIHAHAVLEHVMGAAGRYGPELTAEADGTPLFRIGDYYLRGVRYRGSPFMDVDVRVAQMDEAGIDVQVLSPNPLTYFHFIPVADAVNFCRVHNDEMAALVARHPNRLAGLATLPMQDIDAAIQEMERAVKQLGLLAPYIGTDLTHTLDDPALEPFYQAVVDLNVPLFLHPAPAGIDGPPASPQIKRYELDIIFGFNAQETVAVATLIFGGVLHRHPDLDICISHGGGTVALVYGALEQAGQLRPWAPDYLREEGAFGRFLKRFWFDTHMHGQRALDLLIERVGTERLVYGSNFAGWDAPKRAAPPTDLPLADNARRLLRIA